MLRNSHAHGIRRLTDRDATASQRRWITQRIPARSRRCTPESRFGLLALASAANGVGAHDELGAPTPPFTSFSHIGCHGDEEDRRNCLCSWTSLSTIESHSTWHRRLGRTIKAHPPCTPLVYWSTAVIMAGCSMARRRRVGQYRKAGTCTTEAYRSSVRTASLAP